MVETFEELTAWAMRRGHRELTWHEAIEEAAGGKHSEVINRWANRHRASLEACERKNRSTEPAVLEAVRRLLES